MTQLYRFLSASGRLLYVGISSNAFARAREHGREAIWFRMVRLIAISRYPSREAALKAESVAINEEHPLYNRNGEYAVDTTKFSAPPAATTWELRQLKRTVVQLQRRLAHKTKGTK